MRRSSVECSGKIYAPGVPNSGLKESILFLEIVYFFIFGAKLGGGGRQRSVWRVNVPEKTGARSAWAHTSGQKTGYPKKSFQTLYIKLKLYIAFI